MAKTENTDQKEADAAAAKAAKPSAAENLNKKLKEENKALKAEINKIKKALAKLL